MEVRDGVAAEASPAGRAGRGRAWAGRRRRARPALECRPRWHCQLCTTVSCVRMHCQLCTTVSYVRFGSAIRRSRYIQVSPLHHLPALSFRPYNSMCIRFDTADSRTYVTVASTRLFSCAPAHLKRPFSCAPACLKRPLSCATGTAKAAFLPKSRHNKSGLSPAGRSRFASVVGRSLYKRALEGAPKTGHKATIKRRLAV